MLNSFKIQITVIMPSLSNILIFFFFFINLITEQVTSVTTSKHFITIIFFTSKHFFNYESKSLSEKFNNKNLYFFNNPKLVLHMVEYLNSLFFNSLSS